MSYSISAQVFPFEFYKTLKNTYFVKDLQKAASEYYVRKGMYMYLKLLNQRYFRMNCQIWFPDIGGHLQMGRE